MEANQVRPAIPRQKVKNVLLKRIGSVLNIGEDGKKVAVMTEYPTFFQEWPVEDCEPVPEEPRPLRIGDKVAYEWNGINGSKNATYGTVTAITYYDREETLYHVDGIRVDSPSKIRLATPSELAKYFN